MDEAQSPSTCIDMVFHLTQENVFLQQLIADKSRNVKGQLPTSTAMGREELA